MSRSTPRHTTSQVAAALDRHRLTIARYHRAYGLGKRTGSVILWSDADIDQIRTRLNETVAEAARTSWAKRKEWDRDGPSPPASAAQLRRAAQASSPAASSDQPRRPRRAADDLTGSCQ